MKGFFGQSYEKCAIHRWKKKFWLNLKISQKYMVEDIYFFVQIHKNRPIYKWTQKTFG